jgi:hypothetical protein
MTREDLVLLFHEKLRMGCRTRKYHGQFSPEDEERAVQVFRLVLENANLSDHLILEQLTGEKGT